MNYSFKLLHDNNVSYHVDVCWIKEVGQLTGIRCIMQDTAMSRAMHIFLKTQVRRVLS